MRCDRCDDVLGPEVEKLYRDDDGEELPWGIEVLCSLCAADDAAENAKSAEARHDRD